LSLAEWIWLVSWSLCGSAAAVLGGLVIYRGLANRRAVRRLGLRTQGIERLKARVEQAAAKPGVAADNVLTNLAVDILELVRGDEKAAFAERMAAAGVAARLRVRLGRGSTQTRILAASALASFNDRETVAALTRALDDRRREVRLTAALSLATQGNLPPAREVIERLGIGGRETSLRTVMLLVDLAEADVEDVRSLLGDPAIPPAIKAGAADALARCDDFAAVPAVAELVLAANPAAAELPRLLGALAEFEHPAGTEAVLHCLSSRSPPVRAAAAHAAGRILVGAALGKLEQLLGDADWWVRFKAAQALLRFGDRGQRRMQYAAGASEEPARETAALILAEQAAAA
jgi:HEAT repeat protein